MFTDENVAVREKNMINNINVKCRYGHVQPVKNTFLSGFILHAILISNGVQLFCFILIPNDSGLPLNKIVCWAHKFSSKQFSYFDYTVVSSPISPLFFSPGIPPPLTSIPLNYGIFPSYSEILWPDGNA